MVRGIFVIALVIVLAHAEAPIGRQYLPPSFNARQELSQRYGAPAARTRFGGERSMPSNRFAGLEEFSAQYEASEVSGSFRDAFAPSSQYGAPATSSRFAGGDSLSLQYSVPAASSRFVGVNSPSARYGAPATSIRFSGNSGLSSQYGAPAGGSFGRYNNPSTQYGAPNRFAAAISPFNNYNAPAVPSGPLAGPSFISPQYRAPVPSSRFGEARPLSSQYGAPVAGRSGLSNTYGAPGDFSRTSGVPAAQYGAPLAGYSAQEDPLAEPANYQFSYAVQDAESGSEFGQEESRQLETAQGSYRVLLPDGRLQVVEYQADEEGYKPEIRYEETELSRSAGGPYPASRALQGPY